MSANSENMIRWLCPGCNKRCKAFLDDIGKRSKCPRCGLKMSVPDLKSSRILNRDSIDPDQVNLSSRSKPKEEFKRTIPLSRKRDGAPPKNLESPSILDAKPMNQWVDVPFKDHEQTLDIDHVEEVKEVVEQAPSEPKPRKPRDRDSFYHSRNLKKQGNRVEPSKNKSKEGSSNPDNNRSNKPTKSLLDHPDFDQILFGNQSKEDNEEVEEDRDTVEGYLKSGQKLTPAQEMDESEDVKKTVLMEPSKVSSNDREFEVSESEDKQQNQFCVECGEELNGLVDRCPSCGTSIQQTQVKKSWMSKIFKSGQEAD